MLKNASYDHDGTHNALKNYINFPGKGRPSFNVPKAPATKSRSAPPPVAIPITHFHLRGGRWSVPTECNDEFLWHYAIAMEQGHQFSLVERRTDIFRYHMDLDFNQPEEVTLDAVRQYLLIIQGVLRRFFPYTENMFFELTVSVAPCKTIIGKDGGIDLIKTGYHIIWHHIWIDAAKALDLRASIIDDLKIKYGVRNGTTHNLWEDVVDESIYVSNGLRMIGSMKWSPCRCNSGKKKRKVSTAPFPKTSIVPSASDKKASDLAGADDDDVAGPADSSAMTVSARAALQSLVRSTPVSSESKPHVVASTAAVAEGDVPCEKCHNQGYIFEGRPYFVVALWNYNCEAVDRLISVPLSSSDDTPCYRAPVTLYRSLDGSPLYRAMPLPQWTPFDDDDEENGGNQSKMSAEMVKIPFADLLLFGDPSLHTVNTPHDIWNKVRKLHNLLRITSLRIAPSLEAIIKQEYVRIESGADANMDLARVIPLFKRPAFAPPANSPDSLVERLKYEASSHKRYDTFGKRVELLNECKKWNQQGTMSTITDEHLISQLEQLIRANAGTRHIEPYHPYEDVRIKNVLFKNAKDGKPRSFFVHVEGPGSAYCQNKMSDHHGHSIYFEIDMRFLYQKCFCRCENQVNRLNGPCKDWKKPECALPADLRVKLFGSKNKSYIPGHNPHALRAVTNAEVKPFDVTVCLNNEKFSDLNEQLEFEQYKAQKRQREMEMGLPDPDAHIQRLLAIKKE